MSYFKRVVPMAASTFNRVKSYIPASAMPLFTNIAKGNFSKVSKQLLNMSTNITKGVMNSPQLKNLVSKATGMSMNNFKNKMNFIKNNPGLMNLLKKPNSTQIYNTLMRNQRLYNQLNKVSPGIKQMLYILNPSLKNGLTRANVNT